MVVTTIILFIALLLSFAIYFKMFKKIDLSIDVQGGELIVFKSKTGDYRSSGNVMDEIYESLKTDFNIKSYKGFGIYYDNPREVRRELLRYDAGCIINKQDVSNINKLKERFEIAECPKKRYLIAEFPYKGKTSAIIGVMKVYPAILKYLNKQELPHNGSVMEIYDIPGKRIIYRKELVS